ncbi:hypothetical protein INS49_002423 [Diaporthe citri]|uniref:uncharacterized protein n=1 Tax=Diaporthe citri TaxID=83186 RepID=UPI001C81F229|nr:uncharacterized protein INS49_002423 [Diaporthe citri]KAG6368222.1 hypothetical protein INS49_002423 [Diaporthe citri]
MADNLNAMLKDICRDPEAWKQRHSSEVANARAAYYQPGTEAAWGFDVDNGRQPCNWYGQPGDNGGLKFVHQDAIAVVRRIEPGEGLKANYGIWTWTMAMRLVYNKQIMALRIKTTPQHQQNEYWVFEWLETCPSTSDLSAEQRLSNQQRWVNSGNVSVAVIEDTPNACLSLAVFDKGGKVDNINMVHVIAHFTPLAMEYPDRAKHWAAIISRLPVLAADVQVHSSIPGRIPANASQRRLHSGLMAVMDFVHLSLAGEQYPINERPGFGLCLRTLLSEVASMAWTARRHKLGAKQWDDGGRQAVEASVVGEGASAGLFQSSG